MFTHPSIGSELARVRQRDMLAYAEQQRLARRSRAKSRTTRRAERPGRRICRAHGAPGMTAQRGADRWASGGPPRVGDHPGRWRQRSSRRPAGAARTAGRGPGSSDEQKRPARAIPQATFKGRRRPQ
jgi:hypothetical protein